MVRLIKSTLFFTTHNPQVNTGKSHLFIYLSSQLQKKILSPTGFHFYPKADCTPSFIHISTEEEDEEEDEEEEGFSFLHFS